MTALIKQSDPTLEAVDAAFQARENAQPARHYLGMSSVGHKCLRKLWYGFHWASHKSFDAKTLYRFDDGHRSEAIMAERLRMVPGVTLTTVDEKTGEQFGFTDLGGHFRGHKDGDIIGLIQDPTTRYVWEHKATDEKKQAQLAKLIDEVGEGQALEKWDEMYYAQAQLYMHYSALDRHYLTCASSGTRTVISVITKADPDYAKSIIEKARMVIEAPEPPEGISTNPTFYVCKWCDHQDVCQLGAVPRANCRTCAHSTAELDGNGRWSCVHFRRDITIETQRKSESLNKPCPGHRFIPSLLAPLKPIAASEEAVMYETPEGPIKNGTELGAMTSARMHAIGTIRALWADHSGLTEGERKKINDYMDRCKETHLDTREQILALCEQYPNVRDDFLGFAKEPVYCARESEILELAA